MTKRFYKTAAAQKTDFSYNIFLDEKTLKTPKGSILKIDSFDIANLVAKEWEDVADIINPSLMPITQICMTASDFFDEKKLEWTKDCLNYIESDLICFWSPSHEPIAAWQQERIAPVIQKLSERYNIPIHVTDQLMSMKQDDAWNQILEEILESSSAIELTTFYLTTIECGSIFLCLALAEDLISPQDAFNIIYLEDHFKAEIYKEDIYGTAPDLEQKQKTTIRFLTGAQKVFQSLSKTK